MGVSIDVRSWHISEFNKAKSTITTVYCCNTVGITCTRFQLCETSPVAWLTEEHPAPNTMILVVDL